MPNLDNIRLWCAALRSGDYRQGMGVLWNTESDTWCCLGVAADAARRAGVEMQLADSCGEMRFDEEQAFLPGKVQDWLGIDNCNPMLASENDGTHAATEWNDGIVADFSVIADAVEYTYLREEIV